MRSLKLFLRQYWLLLFAVSGCCIAVLLITTAYHTGSPISASHSSVATTAPSLSTVLTRIDAVLGDAGGLQAVAGPDAANSIGYPLEGYQFAILLPYSAQTYRSFSAGSATTQTQVSAAFQAVLPGLQSVLVSAGFSDQTAKDTNQGLATIFFYNRPDAVCQITSYSLLDIVCAPKAALRGIAAPAQPLISAYRTYPSAMSIQTVATPVIAASMTAGYHTASMAVYGANGETKLNFYQVGNAPWQVVNTGWYNDPHENGDIQPNCAEFESLPMVAAAFKGQACYNSATRRETVIN